MKLEWMVAQRYLRSPHKPAVLRLVTLLSVVGVVAGVSTLVVALAMNAGFQETLQERLVGVTAHVSLERPGSEGIRDATELARRLAGTPGVRAASPAIYQTVLLSARGRAQGLLVKGVEPELERASNAALRTVIAGAADFASDADGIEGLFIGRILAKEMKIQAGDYVTLTSPRGRMTPFGMMPRSRRYRVTGIFDSGFYDYDANWGFVTLGAAQGLAGVGDVVNLIEFRIERLEQATEVARRIEQAAGPGYHTKTWMEENRALFRALRLEKLVTAIFIGLITFVAGLNILVALAMTVTDRARDIAVLMALGARREQVRTIFMLQGVTVGAVGTATGLAIGYALAWGANTYRWIPLDPQVYALPYVPFHANASDGFWIAAATLAISLVATLVPARGASRIFPVKILRYE